MNPGAVVAPVEPLEFVSHIMDDPRRPADFALMLLLAAPLPLERLRAGATSALLRYPRSGSCLGSGRWVWLGASGEDVVQAGEGGAPARYLRVPLDPGTALPVAQWVAAAGRGQLIVTRFHHAACDGQGAGLWLAHQLAVALGAVPPVTEAGPTGPMALHRHPRPRRRSAFAGPGPSVRLDAGGRPGGERGWLTRTRPAWSGRRHGLGETDVLAASFLDALAAWRRERGQRRGRVGLSMPVDLRRQRGEGFGNATSRIRVYAAPAGSGPRESCALVRRQIDWSLRHGEWAVPERLPLVDDHPRLARGLLRAYARRPWVDVGTAPFTHLVRSPLEGPHLRRLPPVEALEAIGPLDRKHAVGLVAVSHAGTTWLTFTHDPGLLPRDEVAHLATLFLARADEITAALAM